MHHRSIISGILSASSLERRRRMIDVVLDPSCGEGSACTSDLSVPQLHRNPQKISTNPRLGGCVSMRFGFTQLFTKTSHLAAKIECNPPMHAIQSCVCVRGGWVLQINTQMNCYEDGSKKNMS